MDNRQSNQGQQKTEQPANPEKLAVSDEAQRTSTKESGERPKKTPTGNERDNQPDTDGTQAGMGE